MDADYQLYVINSAVKKFQKGKKWGDGMWKCGDSLKNVIHNMENQKYSSMKFDGNSKNIFFKLFLFYKPYKHQNTKGFIMCTGDIEKLHCPRIG